MQKSASINNNSLKYWEKTTRNLRRTIAFTTSDRWCNTVWSCALDSFCLASSWFLLTCQYRNDITVHCIKPENTNVCITCIITHIPVRSVSSEATVWSHRTLVCQTGCASLIWCSADVWECSLMIFWGEWLVKWSHWSHAKTTCPPMLCI